MEQTDRDFLRMIQQAIFANPFGTARPKIDRAASGLAPSAQDEEVLAKLVHKVGKTIFSIENKSPTGGGKLSKEDKTLLEQAKLFHVFHIFCDDMDVHIQQQVDRGEERCRVSFSEDLLRMLHNYGFPTGEAIRFLELFFQMRRAFYFTSKIAGSSECVRNLRRVLWNNVFTGSIKLYAEYLWNRMEDFSTMILGETGTGKTMAAAAVGRSGYIPFDTKSATFKDSFARTFVSINLSQFPEQLIESELFGHKKGAFTGAVEPHRGIFSRCSPHGAIFLDEIGDVAVPVQIKLLQVLQERTFTPVGSHKTEKFHGRVIGATNQSLLKAREEGRFRDDFYYRLCSDVIEIPPLRLRIQENPGELGEILGITVARMLGQQSDEIADYIERYIQANQPQNYSWPGNIREVEQCVRQVLLNTRYQWQQMRTVSQEAQLAKDLEDGAMTAAEILAKYCKIHYEKLGTFEGVAKLTGLDRRTVKKHIQRAK